MIIRRLQILKVRKILEDVVVATTLGDSLEEPKIICLGPNLCKIFIIMEVLSHPIGHPIFLSYPG